jgi:hypothetical protein
MRSSVPLLTRVRLPMPTTSSVSESSTDADLLRAVRRIRSRLAGLTLGLLAGVGLFLATAILLLKGGPNVGAHLSLLGQFLPGYHVTWGGAFLGLLYGVGIGFLAGWLIGGIYNAVAGRRHPLL